MPITAAEKETIQSYDAIAESRRQSLTNDIDFWITEFQHLVGSCPDPSLLDLGCGDGREAALYQSLYGNLTNYVGLDLSRGMLECARRRQLLNPSSVEADMYLLPFGSDRFKFIWAAASLIHTPKDQISEQLGEIRRCLGTGGRVFFAMRHGEGQGWEEGRAPSDHRYFVYWTKADFCSLVETNGFKIESSEVDATRDKRGMVWLNVFATKAE
ncbi:class I SAM-dependent methyltransferase [Candidatus Collierbacteria bacterium]|nr:class I SAM-dependent methyltransferase [Candidatus Collierbacteria bacterium]